MQGDPLGPALFDALVVQPIVEMLQLELNCWYLDDASLGDTPDAVLHGLRLVIENAEAVGPSLNPEKSEIAILGAESEEEHLRILGMFREVTPGMIDLEPCAATLLGGPLSTAAMESILDSKTRHFGRLSSRLAKLSAHSAFFLLRASVSMPRLLYFLRCGPAYKSRTHLVDYDCALKLVMEGILNCSLSPGSWLQSSLPVKAGGLGVRRQCTRRFRAFLRLYTPARPTPLCFSPLTSL